MSSSWTRRAWLESGVCLLAAPFLPGPVGASDQPVAEILARSDRGGGRVWFDPVGLWIEPGTTVRWANEANVHTATAYHPDNGGRALRIPEKAVPWDSGYLVNPGDSFEITLSEAGVYDYFCAPHEAAGMVGRLIVGEPTGPGSRSFDWFKDDPDRSHWQPVPEAARTAFPSIDEIMETRVVRLL